MARSIAQQRLPGSVPSSLHPKLAPDGRQLRVAANVVHNV